MLSIIKARATRTSSHYSEECIIESAMFTIEGDDLFVSNVGGGAFAGRSPFSPHDDVTSGPGFTMKEPAAEGLKPEDAAAGGEYVGIGDKEAVAEANAAGDAADKIAHGAGVHAAGRCHLKYTD